MVSGIMKTAAAVNESVRLCSKVAPKEAAGMVNAVLRNAAQNRESLKKPISFAQKYSHPDELITLLKANLPKGTLEGMLIADNEITDTVVQVNTLKITAEALISVLEAEGVKVKPHPWMENCLILQLRAK